MSERRIRCGDHVLHAPTGETWVVAWADYETGDLAWCGWPNGMARLSECALLKAATEKEHYATLEQVLCCNDSRALRAARLYGGANG